MRTCKGELCVFVGVAIRSFESLSGVTWQRLRGK